MEKVGKLGLGKEMEKVRKPGSLDSLLMYYVRNACINSLSSTWQCNIVLLIYILLIYISRYCMLKLLHLNVLQFIGMSHGPS